jgi:hypothetical protein
LFFLERKNQRTSIHLALPVATARTQMDKSLFASFSSEKEYPPCLIFFPEVEFHPL